ncbi:MAG: hypothetical protein COB09_17760 [Thalassobium sp.]|nr:MAG: hypothetical protein COB09_17760 [Thalassobium sp.]
MTPNTHASAMADPELSSARQLLGTLSKQPQDIEAAYQHQIRHTASLLLQPNGADEHQQLSQTLIQLMEARRCLLSETNPAATATVLPTQNHISKNQQHTINAQRTNNNAMTTTQPLTLVIGFLLLFSAVAAALFSQQQHINGLQQQLLSQQQSLQFSQQQLAQQLTVQQQERAEWRHTQQEYQHQITAAQQQLLAQQQQASAQQQEWQQRLANVDKALALEQREGDSLQQRINRLSRVSEELIANLCADSAAVGPAVGLTIYAQYMQRCQQSWELAAQ